MLPNIVELVVTLAKLAKSVRKGSARLPVKRTLQIVAVLVWISRATSLIVGLAQKLAVVRFAQKELVKPLVTQLSPIVMEPVSIPKRTSTTVVNAENAVTQDKSVSPASVNVPTLNSSAIAFAWILFPVSFIAANVEQPAVQENAVPTDHALPVVPLEPLLFAKVAVSISRPTLVTVANVGFHVTLGSNVKKDSVPVRPIGNDAAVFALI